MDISGKTGTAQVVGRKDDEDEKLRIKKHRSHAFFAAYAPSKTKSEIAVYVLIEHGEHGSSQASPIAMKLIRHYFKLKKTNSNTKK